MDAYVVSNDSCCYFAVVFRANLPLSVAGVWISNPITMPPMMYFAYLFGNKLLGLNPTYESLLMMLSGL